jgi:L-threonylcarbamoyladenylate synthase
LAALRAAKHLCKGGLIAHHTSTVAGVAASPHSAASLSKLLRFEQRPGPFLLLADTTSTAMALARYISPAFRRLATSSWPGTTTLIFAGKPGLPRCCYSNGNIAVRVDQSLQTRQLARASGGFILSSSLNRKNKKTAQPSLQLTMRSHRFLSSSLAGCKNSGKSSSILRVWRNDSSVIRP